MNEQKDMGGMNAFFNEALQLIPQDEVTTLFLAKLENNKLDFSSFIDNLATGKS